MLRTLHSKILFYLLLVSMSGILLVSFSIQWGFEESFKAYLNANRDKNISRVKDEVVINYKKTGTLTNEQLYNLLHQQAMTENLYYQIYDNSGKLVADSTGMRAMMNNMGAETPSKGKMDSSTKRIKLDKKQLGTIRVYYPKGLVDTEFAFLQTIQQYIFMAVALTIILSFLFSMLFSKRVASGFKRLSEAVAELQNHNLNVRIPVSQLSEEMKPLGNAFNNLAESLLKQEKLRKQFTGDLAHELRTPLAAVRSQIEAFQDGIWEPTPKRLQQSHDELMRLVRLVNELEQLLAAENPQIKLNIDDLEAGEILSVLEDQFGPVFHEKGVRLEIISSEKKLAFKADRDRLIQILTNILNNALKYTSRGGNVKVSFAEQNKMAGFVIEDDGVGIPAEDLPYIFERFYRGDKSRDRKTGGAGIGLSVVKALVEAHKGRVKIESELNKGTKVAVFFPKS